MSMLFLFIYYYSKAFSFIYIYISSCLFDVTKQNKNNLKEVICYVIERYI
nr:MAG TPA: hypothetical protein [Caudoviricetes sp.]